jgi:hypothetical protein
MSPDPSYLGEARFIRRLSKITPTDLNLFRLSLAGANDAAESSAS